MEEALFSELFSDLPIVSTDDELEKVKREHSSLDPYYIASGCIAERRSHFESLWPAFAPYADSHFLKELKLKFHQRTWEMYLCNVLLIKKLPIKSNDEGPDFIVLSSSGKAILYIECIAPTKGVNADAVAPISSTPFGQPLVLKRVPEENIILRITAALKEKADKYRSWAQKDWFDSRVPYVIALNVGDLEYPGNPHMPYALKAVFGIGHPYMNIDVVTQDTQHGWTERPTIERSSGSLVSTNSFLGASIDHVSGILFSDLMVLNHPGEIGTDCLFVNNPFGINPMNDGFSDLFAGWIAAQNDNGSITLRKRKGL